MKVATKVDLSSLKSDVDKLDMDKLKYVPTNWSNLKNKEQLSGITIKQVYW